ncbi:MAG TPA: glycosyltransferase family 39 protein, partial [Kofleriaceae bacterium]|nr:glycosyltransferase family 39 protein [Kofleriaceae bacterium]
MYGASHDPPVGARRRGKNCLGRGAAIAIAAAATLVLATEIAVAPPLGFDEAVYALGGRSLVGVERSYYPDYRPAGMRAVAALGVLAGGKDWQLRIVPAALALAFGAAAIRLARRWHGAAAARLVAACLLAWPQLVERGAQLLSDLPAALAGLVALGELIAATERDEPHPLRRAALAGTAAAASFWLRYGAVVAIAATGAAVLVARPRRWRLLAVFAAIVVAAIAPWLWYSEHQTGSLAGIALDAQHAAGNPHVGAGLATYASGWFVTIAGPVVGVVALIGIYAAARRRSTPWAIAALAAVVQLIGLGL